MEAERRYRLPIEFDPELRARINAFAADSMRSMAGAVRYLVKYALDDIDRRKRDQTT